MLSCGSVCVSQCVCKAHRTHFAITPWLSLSIGWKFRACFHTSAHCGGLATPLHPHLQPSTSHLSKRGFTHAANLVKFVIYKDAVNRIMLCCWPDEKPAAVIRGEGRTPAAPTACSISSRHIRSIWAPRVRQNTKRPEVLIRNLQEEGGEKSSCCSSIRNVSIWANSYYVLGFMSFLKLFIAAFWPSSSW